MSARLRDLSEPARFSRAWWLSRLRGALWVAIISILIWLYADLEFTKEREYPAAIHLQANARDLELVSQAEHKVSFTLRGPVSNLERFRRWLDEDAGGVLRYDVSADFQPGDTGVPVERVLRAAGRIETFGLTYKAAAPNYLPLKLEWVEEREVPIHPDSERMALPPIQDKVAVRASPSRWAQIDARVAPQQAFVRTEPIELDLFGPDIAPGAAVTRRAKLVPRIVGAYDVPVRLETDTVPFSFQVREIPDVPVDLVPEDPDIAPDVEPARATVRVTAAQHERLPAGKLRLRAKPAAGPVDLDPGETATMPAEIVPRIGEVWVQVRPQVVEFQVKAWVERKTLTVRVLPLAPAAWVEDGTWDRYKLVRKTELEWSKDITVLGLKTDVEQLKASDVEAVVELKESDKGYTEAWLSRQVRVRFPPNMRVKLAGEPPTVEFRLERKTPAP